MKKILLIIAMIAVLMMTGCNKNNETIINQGNKEIENNENGVGTNSNISVNTKEDKKEREELSSLLDEKFDFVDFEENALDSLLNSELSEDEKSVIEYGTILSIEGGRIYIFDINGDLDDSLFEKLKHLDIGSWYRYYDEEYFIICTKKRLVIALANNELNAPETDASVIKNICKEYFGEENIERIYEEQLNGTHNPIEDSI